MIKDVIVHLDGTLSDEERLQHAEALASASQAHLTGLFTNPLPDFATLIPMDGGVFAADVIVKLEEDAHHQGDLAHRPASRSDHGLHGDLGCRLHCHH